jgi:hypothetical protein
MTHWRAWRWTSAWHGPSTLFELLERIALELERAGIPYMVTGGQAVLLYGEPRLTRDIDITLGVSTDQLDLVRDVCT